ncbi:MAG: class I SAM-dependent methyltransferase [Peptostreptococcaceae bacterium]
MENFYIAELNKFNSEMISDKSYTDYINFSKKIVAHYTTNDHYSNKYKNYENNYWHNLANWIFDEYKLNENKANLKVLDVGCAYGTLAVYLKSLFGAEIYAIDLIKNYIGDGLIRDLAMDFKLMDIECENLKWDVKFDKIIFTEVLEHFRFNPIPTFEKLYDALKDDGLLYLSTPISDSWGKIGDYDTFLEMPYPNSKSKLNHGHNHHYDEQEILELFKMTKFKVVKKKITDNNLHFNFILSK